MLQKDVRPVWNIKNILLFLLIGFIGSGLHFVWEHIYMFPWAQILAPLVPVNESYWEHTKLAIWPLLVYFIVQYFLNFRGKKEKGTWIVSTASGLWAAVVSMFVLHATLVSVLGDSVELVISIVVFFINVGLGMTVFKYVSSIENAARFKAWGMALFILLIASEVVYTYAPIPIELFKSTDNNYFGQFPPGG